MVVLSMENSTIIKTKIKNIIIIINCDRNIAGGGENKK